MFEILLGKRNIVNNNNGFGIFGGGHTYSGLSKYTHKYTYSNNVVIPETLLGVARHSLAATGNSEFGIFGGGSDSAKYSKYTDKYTYSNNVVTPGAWLGEDRSGASACSSSPGGF